LSDPLEKRKELSESGILTFICEKDEEELSRKTNRIK